MRVEYKLNGIAINDDCNNIRSYIGDRKFELQIHDIPYKVSRNRKNIKVAGRTDIVNDFGEWDKEGIDLPKFAKDVSNFSTPDGSAIIFFNNWYYFSDLVKELQSRFSIVDCLVWCKRNPSPQFRKRRFVSAHELIIWCARGKYTLNNASHRRMFSYRDNSDSDFTPEDIVEPSYIKTALCQGNDRMRVNNKTFHPTQKPIKLIEYYIKRLSNEGDNVLDMYAGSLTTGRACDNTGRSYVVCERDDYYFNGGLKTLK